MKSLPKKLYECEGVVVLYKASTGCGILELIGDQTINCFFLSRHIVGRAIARIGSRMFANARLVDQSSQVPFLAASVWHLGDTLDQSLVKRLLAPASLDELEQYTSLANNMALELDLIYRERRLRGDQGTTRESYYGESDNTSRVHDDNQGTTRESYYGESDNTSKVHDDNKRTTRESYSGASDNTSRVHDDNQGTTRDLYYEEDNTPRRENNDKHIGEQKHGARDTSYQSPYAPINSKRFKSPPPPSPPPEEYGRVDNPKDAKIVDPGVPVCDVVEEFPLAGVEGEVDKFYSDTVGQILILDGDKVRKVLFNAAQVWVEQSDEQFPFLEIYPANLLRKLMDLGSKVKLNARLAPGGTRAQLQATAVWTCDQAPTSEVYRTSLLRAELDLQIRQHFFLLTGDTRLVTNPLAGEVSEVMTGTVVENVTDEMGIVHLDQGEGDSVLFHLNQIWMKQEDKICLYKDDQKEMMSDHLPIGSHVMLCVKRLPAHRHSLLKWQATIIWKNKEGEDASLPSEFINKYTMLRQRADLVDELVYQHDSFKSIHQLRHGALHTDFGPVHAVLNGLPLQWQGEVIATINDQFGIIQLSNIDGIEFDVGPGAKYLYVMFHVSDVYDIERPAGSQILMEELINRYVDLTARPICNVSQPDDIFKLQSNLVDENMNYGEIPLLQAIVVCVKRFPYSEVDTSNIPQPTCLTGSVPGSFGQSEYSYFYLSITLKARMDIKFQTYLSIPNNLAFLYQRVMKKVIVPKQEVILNELSKLDSNNTRRFTFGKLNPGKMTKFGRNINRNFQKNENVNSLRGHPVTITYLHCGLDSKSESGLLELTVKDNRGGRIRTYAFFDQSRLVSFKDTPNDLDLTKSIPLNSEAKYLVHAELAFPDTVVPYVVLALWCEDDRQESGAPQPVPCLRQDQNFFDAGQVLQQNQIYFQACFTSIVDLLEVAAVRSTRALEDNRFMVWKDVVENFYGKVIRLVNSSYGIAVGFLTEKHNSAKCIFFQVLFDACDVFIDKQDCDELGKSLEDVLEVGDFVKFNAVRIEVETVPSRGFSREVRYLATALVFAKTSEDIQKTDIPAEIPPIKRLDQVDSTKVDNFKSVVKILGKTRPDAKEKEILKALDSGHNVEKGLKKAFITPPKKKERPERKNDTRGESDVLDKDDKNDGRLKENKKQCEENRKNREDSKTKGEGLNIREESKDSSLKEKSKEKNKDLKEKKKDQKEKKKDKPKLTEGDMDTLIAEINAKQLRKLIMAYMDFVNKLPDITPRTKIDMQVVAKAANLDKDNKFLEKFFLLFAHKARNAFKGMKVGHVFVTQTQAKMIMNKGIMSVEDIDKGDNCDKRENNEVGDICDRFPSDKFRKFLISYLKLFECEMSFDDIAKEHNVSVKTVKELLISITKKCKALPVANNKRDGFKLNSIFINASWVDQILGYNLQ